MQRTRRQILDILKKRGRATLEELAREVALSPVTVRVHLSVLQRDDLVSVEEVRGRVGRPYFVYSLTEEAEELFPKRYHVLANRLLAGLDEVLPLETRQTLFSYVAERWAAERAQRLVGKGLTEKVAEVARIRSEEGAIADWEKVEEGYLLRQYNCPNLAVCRLHPQVCHLEEEYISRLVGTPLRRQGCIGRGDRVCSYLIPED
ncbi:MAG: helix-turn-helix transcriptional regulator [Chloroflexota bacterium]